MNDPYLDLIDTSWDNIVMMYQYFGDKKPIIEYELPSQKIYSCPAQEYINALSLRTRENARKQYEDAVKKHQFMVFIRDHKKKKLRSYIFDLPF